MEIKFRVYTTEYCKFCKEKHPFPTDRYIRHKTETKDKQQAIQEAHKVAVEVLKIEGAEQRPLFQSVING